MKRLSFQRTEVELGRLAGCMCLQLVGPSCTPLLIPAESCPHHGDSIDSDELTAKDALRALERESLAKLLGMVSS